MPLYRSTVRHGRFAAGETVDIASDLVAQYQGEIDAGFLIPVGPGVIAGTFRDLVGEQTPEHRARVDAAKAEAIAEHEAVGNPIPDSEPAAVDRPDPTLVLPGTHGGASAPPAPE